LMHFLFSPFFTNFLRIISCRSSSFIRLPILLRCCKNNCESYITLITSK
jgi:hypothetical protein